MITEEIININGEDILFYKVEGLNIKNSYFLDLEQSQKYIKKVLKNFNVLLNNEELIITAILTNSSNGPKHNISKVFKEKFYSKHTIDFIINKFEQLMYWDINLRDNILNNKECLMAFLLTKNFKVVPECEIEHLPNTAKALLDIIRSSNNPEQHKEILKTVHNGFNDIFYLNGFFIIFADKEIYSVMEDYLDNDIFKSYCDEKLETEFKSFQDKNDLNKTLQKANGSKKIEV